MDKVLSLILGKYKVNLYVIYVEIGGSFVDRDELKLEYFENWVKWVKERGLGLDFNLIIFFYLKLSDGLILLYLDKKICDFWIKYCIVFRKIGEYFGKEFG